MPEYMNFCNLSSFADDTKLVKEIKNTVDINKLQKDIDSAHDFKNKNNLEFNTKKFVHLRYDPFKIIPEDQDTSYKSTDKALIEQKQTAKDLGIYMSSNLKFTDHIDNLVSKCRQLIGWILRTFRSRGSLPMLTLWKSLTLSRIDYCSQLWAPHKIGEIKKIEAIQRTFTSYISNVKDENYWNRLKTLRLYSVERRFERYLIIYLWKIIEDLVPKPTDVDTTSFNSRTGRKICVSHLPNIPQSIQTVIYNSPLNRAKRLFNCLPKELRNLTAVSTDIFKNQLDKFLSTLSDEPGVSGYKQFRAASSNSIIDQLRYKMVVSRTQPCSTGAI